MVEQRRESPSFMTVLADARHIPEGIDPLQERDAPSRMDPENRDAGLVSPPQFDNFDQIGAKVNCLQFSEVLVLWRPWETCGVCKTRVTDDPTLMPPDGTYVCPHVQKVRYKEVVDSCLSGKGALATKEFFNLKNGTRVVHVEWLEGDPEHRAQLIKEEEEAQERKVYPPDPKKAFAKGKNKK